MWSSVTRLGPDVMYKLNHFVFLVPRSDVQPDIISINDDDQHNNADHDDANSDYDSDIKLDNVEDSGNTSVVSG